MVDQFSQGAGSEFNNRQEMGKPHAQGQVGWVSHSIRFPDWLTVMGSTEPAKRDQVETPGWIRPFRLGTKKKRKGNSFVTNRPGRAIHIVAGEVTPWSATSFQGIQADPGWRSPSSGI